MALTTSLRAPLDEGDVWLLALLWAYILPPSVYLLLCVSELLYWRVLLHRKLRQLSVCEYAEQVAQVGGSNPCVDSEGVCVFTPINSEEA